MGCKSLLVTATFSFCVDLEVVAAGSSIKSNLFPLCARLLRMPAIRGSCHSGLPYLMVVTLMIQISMVIMPLGVVIVLQGV